MNFLDRLYSIGHCKKTSWFTTKVHSDGKTIGGVREEEYTMLELTTFLTICLYFGMKWQAHIGSYD